MQMYRTWSSGSDRALRADLLRRPSVALGVEHDTQLSVEELKSVVEFKELVARERGQPFPEDPPEDQLWGRDRRPCSPPGTRPRAKAYRRINRIQEDLGTAVNMSCDGVRQHGIRLLDRRGLHAESFDGRAEASSASS
jgi:pyruvate, orthophosphate dikinase